MNFRRTLLFGFLIASLSVPLSSCSSSGSSASNWKTVDNPTTGKTDPLTAVSCVSKTFCMAVSSNGFASEFSRGKWVHTVSLNKLSRDEPNYQPPPKKPKNQSPFDPSYFRVGNEQFSSVSCVTSAHCVVVASEGSAFTFDAGSWTRTQINHDGAGAYLQYVSCASVDFCLAVGSIGDSYIFSSGQWSYSSQLFTSEAMTFGAVDCPGINDCFVGVASAEPSDAPAGGDVYHYVNGTWSPGQSITDSDIRSLSCAQSSSCEASTNAGGVIVYLNGVWGKEKMVVPTQTSETSEYLPGISCPQANQCFSYSSNGNIYKGFNNKWEKVFSAADSSVEALASISCPNTTFCLAVGYNASLFLNNVKS